MAQGTIKDISHYTLHDVDNMEAWRKSFYSMFKERPSDLVSPENIISSVRESFFSQKFGVEIELEGLAVEEAGKFLEAFFPTYRATVHDNKWTVKDFRNRPWEASPDASLKHGFEIISPPLTVADIHIVKQIVSYIGKVGARASQRTGVHIHVDAKQLNIRQIFSLILLYANYSADLAAALDIAPHRRANYCKSIVDYATEIARKKPTIKALEQAWYVRYSQDGEEPIPPADTVGRHGTRYCEINLHRYFTTRNTK